MTTKLLICCLLFLITVFEVHSSNWNQKSKNRLRSFEVDYENDVFLMDGEPFQFAAGSFHYFRCPHQYWRDRLRTMRAAGLNAVTTYVEWSFHEPKYRQYDWTGDKDLVKFIQLAEEEDLYVILRPGPYICAERDLGGFPYWLLTKYPQIKLRTNDDDYKAEVTVWYEELMSRMRPYLYGRGGPIIMVQVENEYGSYRACDRQYMAWLANLTESWVGESAVLFTTDGPTLGYLECGATPGVFATVDFGPGYNVTDAWEAMRQVNGGGPVVNSEFYPGWLTHWGEDAISVSTSSIVSTMKDMFDTNGNFNFYMFYGGTNFGYTAGANLVPEYAADITSYDYDAPITEAGDTTTKYMEIRRTIAEHMTVPDLEVPPNRLKGAYGVHSMKPVLSLLDVEGRIRLGDGIVQNSDPLSFEALDQYSGLVLYETTLPSKRPDPSLLIVEDLRDRALVYTDEGLIGALSRSTEVDTIAIMEAYGNNLGILVENQGRVNYGLAEDFKGILGDVTLNSKKVQNWTMTKYPLETIESAIDDLISVKENVHVRNSTVSGFLRDGPIVYSSVFTLPQGEPLDTFLDVTNWGKGVVWLNDINLGRYWPGIGPQVTLYVPGVYFKEYPNENKLIILELQQTPNDFNVEFVDVPNLGHSFKDQFLENFLK